LIQDKLQAGVSKGRRLFICVMQTERLILRKYVEKDKANFISLFTDAAVMKHVGDVVMTREQSEAFWRKLIQKLYPQNFNIWAVFTKEDSRYVGHAGIYRRPSKMEDWEFVYFLCRGEWDKGFATEIAQRLVRFGFEELNLPEIFASVDDDHPASIKVLEKAGLSFKNYEYDEDGRYSVYSIKKI
jgi:[ribosomal protein S5]-alanine N-acetyltransferase